MVLGMLFENFKNYYILRYVIYEFLKKVLGVPQPTCLVRVLCAQPHSTARVRGKNNCPGRFCPRECVNIIWLILRQKSVFCVYGIDK